MNEASLKIKVIINQLVITHGGSVLHENTIGFPLESTPFLMRGGNEMYYCALA
jgi:hypothetical protein